MMALGRKAAGEVKKRWELIVWTSSFLVALSLLSACGEKPQFAATPSRFERVTRAYDAVTTATRLSDFSGRAAWAGKCFSSDPNRAWGAAVLIDTARGTVTVLGGRSLPERAYLDLDRAALLAEADAAPRALVDSASALPDDAGRLSLVARSAGARADKAKLSFDFALRRGKSSGGATLVYLEAACGLDGGCHGDADVKPAAKGTVLVACYFTHDTEKGRDSDETKTAERDMDFLMGLR